MRMREDLERERLELEKEKAEEKRVGMKSERVSRESDKLETISGEEKKVLKTARGGRRELDAVRESQSELVNEEERGRMSRFNGERSRGNNTVGSSSKRSNQGSINSDSLSPNKRKCHG